MAKSLLVHRCRFIDWMPHSVTALAFSPDETRLAVARANGNIDLLSSVDGWHTTLVCSIATWCSHLCVLVL
jgi:U3 small nucleolar RNA-associated protein 4